jgi:hypothetical protein
MPFSLTRRELVRWGGLVPAWTHAQPTATTERSVAEAETVSGTVVDIEGDPVPNATVVAVPNTPEDEGFQAGSRGYTEDADHRDLPTVSGRTDTDGVYVLDVSDLPSPHLAVARFTDADGEVWFSTFEPGGVLTLNRHLLFPARAVQTDTYGVNTDTPIPIYSGTVTAWRWVNPVAPERQYIRVALTETASGLVNIASRSAGEQIRPWELTIDRGQGEYGSSEVLTRYHHAPIQNALFSLTLPERIGDTDVSVVYEDVRIYEATEQLGGPVDDQPVREALTHWHPLRRPIGVPAFIRGAARDHYTAVNLEERLADERSATRTLSTMGAVGTLSVGLVSGGLGTALSAVGAATAASGTGFDTGSRPGSPGTTVGPDLSSERRPSENTHDTVDRLWVDPPADLFGGEPVGTAASVVFDVPLVVGRTAEAGSFLVEALWDAGDTAAFTQPFKLNPQEYLLGEVDSLGGPSEFKTKGDESNRGEFEFTAPTTVPVDESFEVDGQITEAPTEQYGAFKIFVDGKQVASAGLQEGEARAVSFIHSFGEPGQHTLTIEVRFTNADRGIDELVGRVTFPITVVGAGGITTNDSGPFDAGEGTRANPYQISTASQLQAIERELDAHYKLVDDVDASGTADWNGGAGFDPIGELSEETERPFTGSLRGNGHRVEGLFVDRANEAWVGLFRFTEQANVEGVRLMGVTVMGGDVVGGLLGTARETVVRGVDLQGVVTAEGLTVGGLGGRVFDCRLERCRTAVDVTAGPLRSGGLLGNLVGGTVAESFSTGSAESEEFAGGLVGTNSGGIIERSFSLSRARGQSNVGGLVGRNHSDGRVAATYAEGSVAGADVVGGLVGWNQTGMVTRSFAVGVVASDGTTGGLVARNDPVEADGGARVTGSYWDVEETAQETSAGSDRSNGRATSEMTGEEPRQNMPALNFDGTWQTTDSYPELGWHHDSDRE